MSTVYKITYPNRKIYVGQDITDSIAYFGSPDSELVDKDFTREQLRSVPDTKEILWESATATQAEVDKKERELIVSLRANDPAVGYNKWPAIRGRSREPAN